MNRLEIARFTDGCITLALSQLTQIMQQMEFAGISDWQKQNLKQLKNNSVKTLWELRDYLHDIFGIIE